MRSRHWRESTSSKQKGGQKRKERDGRAVLFYIHGGSFSNGDGISRDGAALVETEDVIVVSVNYRLQWLGFLNTGGEGGRGGGEAKGDIPSNLGMWDVVAALRWVQDHIHYFGGDPDKVTSNYRALYFCILVSLDNFDRAF